MKRLFESCLALFLLFLLLPVLALAWMGLMLGRTRPILVEKEVRLPGGTRIRLLGFSCRSSRFGLWLRRLPPTEMLPSLFLVVSGRARLADLSSLLN